MMVQGISPFLIWAINVAYEKELIRKLLLRMCEGNGIISEPQAIWINQQAATHKRIKSSKNVLTDSCG